MIENDLHDTRLRATEALLFGLVPRGDPRSAPEALSELADLADTGLFRVAGCVTQHRRHPDPNTYMGIGKVEELAELVGQTHAGVVICDEPLTPSQARNVEKVVGVPVLDRSELIIHIFAQHASSPQARLQVELAELQYQLPRLKRLWTHLERQRGGIAVRGGAGEKQIDIDRSLLRSRIAQVKRELKRIGRRRSREVSSRGDRFTVALVGYTNAGKSTLMNRITSAGVVAEDKLFSTLDTRTRPWRLPGGRAVLLSDTVGFIRNLPHQLVASFHATLEEALNADLLLHVVDCSASGAREQMQTVVAVLNELSAASIPRIAVLNKVDRLADRAELAPLLLQEEHAVAVSARTGEGIDNLAELLHQHLGRSERRIEILVPHHAGALHAEVRRNTTVLSESYNEEGCLMECLISPSLLDRLLSRGAVLPTSTNDRHPESRA